MKLQKAWRGKLARNRVKTITEEVKTENKMKEDADVAAKMEEDREAQRVKAAILIQRAYRRFRYRRQELKRLQERNQLRRQKTEFQQKEKADMFRKNMLIRRV